MRAYYVLRRDLFEIMEVRRDLFEIMEEKDAPLLAETLFGMG